MSTYNLTVFTRRGEKLFDEPFEAENDEEAKVYTERKLEEEAYEDPVYRCVSSDARLIAFKS